MNYGLSLSIILYSLFYLNTKLKEGNEPVDFLKQKIYYLSMITTKFQKLNAFDKAQEAISVLSSVKSKLSTIDEETLSILIDKELLGTLQKSLQEAHEGKLEPLTNIL